MSRLEQLEQALPGLDNDLTLDFTHNPAGQIHTAARDNDLFAFTGNANLNRADTINGLNQVTATGGTTVTHNANGNISAIPGSGSGAGGSQAFGYTTENRLASARAA